MKALLRLNKYFVKYKWHVLLGTVFVVAQTYLAIYPAEVVRKSLDSIISAMKSMDSSVPEAKEQLAQAIISKMTWYLLLIIGVAIGRGILMFLMRQTIIIMSRQVEYDMKNDIYKHYQNLSLAFYRRNNTGDLMNRISEDVGRVRMYIGPAVMYSINLVVLIILVTLKMLTVNATLTLYVLAPLPLLSLSIYFVSDLMNKKSEEVQFWQSRLSTFVQEAFSGIRILKSFVKEEDSTHRFEQESNVYKDKNMSLVKVNSFFFPLMLLLVGLSTLLTVFIGGKEVIAGRATTGNIAEFIIYVNMLTWPMASLGWVTSIVQRAAASQERLNEFLRLQPEIVSGTLADRPIKGSIRFEHVSFIYPDSGIQALKDVSFQVDAGKSIAILGHTGSGKSTIANLLVRMYDPSSGRITIDGTDLKELSLDSLRRQTGYVPQDVFLFSDTIANNIAFGIHDAKELQTNKEVIYTAAKDAAIYDNIMAFPKGFETLVGERGITLSGGQKQRVSIARAIVKKPSLLIFDDCLSAVDTKTESRILKNLNRIMQGTTTVIISHRVSSVRQADQIIVLENGTIVEQGNHFSLLEKNGRYAELHEKQMLEEE